MTTRQYVRGIRSPVLDPEPITDEERRRRRDERRAQVTRDDAASRQRYAFETTLTGLFEAVPRGGEWTRDEMENWLALAESFFELCFDLPPKDGDE